MYMVVIYHCQPTGMKRGRTPTSLARPVGTAGFDALRPPDASAGARATASTRAIADRAASAVALRPICSKRVLLRLAACGYVFLYEGLQT